MNRCDIVIPVYNAYDAVKECVESVLAHTTLEKVKLILIDDKSTDERILPLLEEFVEKNAGKVILLKNEENLGFVRTVNKGFKYTTGDVLLLNSDTEVTEGWLEKIRRCAYSDEMIATVTPLSNYASLASVPRIFLKNELPKGYNLEKMSKLVEDCSLKLYPEIPSAHGFCMYVKREVLDKVGLFDEETFGKGYGEENDFSFRCLKYGYRHILCDDTYILHKGAESFGEKGQHNAELAARYPEIWSKIDLWSQRREIGKIGDNLALKLSLEKKRANVLVIANEIEDLMRDGSLGAIDGAREKCNFHILTAEEGCYALRSFFEEYDMGTGIFERAFAVEKVRFYAKDYYDMLEKILGDFGISLVYVANLRGHCLDVAKVCKKKKVKYLVNLNDYLCNLDMDGQVDLAAWREEGQKLVDGAEKVLTVAENEAYEVNKNNLVKVDASGETYKKCFLKYGECRKLNYNKLRDEMLEEHMIRDIIWTERKNLDSGHEVKKSEKVSWWRRFGIGGLLG